MREEEGTAPLETPRLSLRRFAPTDAEAIFTGWAADAEVTRFLRWSAHQSAAETRALLKGWCAAYDEEPGYHNWAVCLKNGELIGSIGAAPGRHGLEIGYALARAHWGNGYATEALAAVRDHLAGLGLCPLWCCYAVQNAASGRVIAKAGFVDAGADSYESFDHTRQFDCRCCRYPAE